MSLRRETGELSRICFAKVAMSGGKFGGLASRKLTIVEPFPGAVLLTLPRSIASNPALAITGELIHAGKSLPEFRSLGK
jgi:hypothetical protein